MNLQFSLTEEQNKKVGAIGVKPDAGAAPGAAPPNGQPLPMPMMNGPQAMPRR